VQIHSVQSICEKIFVSICKFTSQHTSRLYIHSKDFDVFRIANARFRIKRLQLTQATANYVISRRRHAYDSRTIAINLKTRLFPICIGETATRHFIHVFVGAHAPATNGRSRGRRTPQWLRYPALVRL